jgi:hypothetical protein
MAIYWTLYDDCKTINDIIKATPVTTIDRAIRIVLNTRKLKEFGGINHGTAENKDHNR